MLNNHTTLHRAVTVGDLRAYLLGTGWQLKPFNQAQVLYFEGPLADDGTPLVQLVPASGQYRDFPQRVEEIVQALSSIEQRPAGDILRDILSPTCDRTRVRLDSAETKTGTIEMRFVEPFFRNTRNLFVYGACGELQPQRFFERPWRQAIRFADRCRVRPAPVGSFMVDVETPLVPPATEMQIHLHDYPLERRILLSLMDGLGLLQDTIESGQTRLIFEKGAPRLNANVCEALLGLRPDTADPKVEIAVSWSREWPLPDRPPPAAVRFEGKAFEQIEAIARALRTGNEPQRRKLRGRVVRLTADDPLHGEPGELVIVLQVESANAPPRVELALAPGQYRVACDAHRDGRQVVAAGLLDRSGRRWMLFDVSDFAVMPEEATL